MSTFNHIVFEDGEVHRLFPFTISELNLKLAAGKFPGKDKDDFYAIKNDLEIAKIAFDVVTGVSG